MKLPKSAKRNYTALAFIIPFLGMLAVMVFSQYKPFGKYSMLYSDMYHQYYPFFVAFRKTLLRGGSLLYSWNVGMGMDYLGLISYYLASPLNLLSIFVPESWLLSFFSLLVPIKLGLSSAFFAFFLKNVFQKNDISISVFGAFYGLCAWALGYQWNVMWLDTFALLPLVVLGTVSLIRDKKFVLYTFTLFLSVFANYYIGFFTCIFVALVFFCYEFCRFPGWKRFFTDLLRIAFFSALAIAMTAILSLPTLQALQTTQSSVNKFPTTFRLNIASENTIFGLFDAMRQVAGNMGGGLEPTFKEGLPNLYCGIGTILLGMLFLLSFDIRWKDKVCAVFLLLFFNISFIIRQLDYIWHGFHFTNMIPYRFSFLYSFVLLYMAYRAWLQRRKYDILQIIAAAFLTAAILCCSNDLTSSVSAEFFGIDLEFHVYLIYNVCFLMLYTCVLCYGCLRPGKGEDTVEAEVQRKLILRSRRKISRTVFFVSAALELTAALVTFGLYFPGTAVSNYPKGTDSAASMIRYMHERESDTLFFRAETTHSQTLNDGALNGYNGISTFTSSANVKITEFMRVLGYGAKNTYNRYCFEESSPVANLFLDLKYMIDRDGRDRASSVFDEIHHYGKVSLLKNNAYLPLGFLAEKELGELDFFAQTNAFSFQNSLFCAATGLQQDVWEKMQAEITGDGVSLDEIKTGGYLKYSDCVSGAVVYYTYTVERDGFVCVHLNLPKRNDFYVSVNGDELYKESISLPQMLAVKDVAAGDTIEIRILCDSGESGNMTVTASQLNNELFFEGYRHLSESELQLTTFRDTFVEGKIQCSREGLLYTSIPQNGNWTAQVDGESADITLVGDCMIAVPLSEGTHTVVFTYRNPAFSLGWKITLTCMVIFGCFIYVCYYPDWKRMNYTGKYRKK